MTPTDHMSDFWSYGLRISTSGDTKKGVPHCFVSVLGAYTLVANPKSASFMSWSSSSLVIRRFLGFMSQCATPFS